MNKEDYFKYYIQDSVHYLIPKDIFDELFDEMESWKQDTQQKEFIEYLTSYIDLLSNKPDLIEEAEIDILEEILSKYREIIGEIK